ncbi:hypothetical protein niasHT_017358 [Heterodera trifolii]|uniref:F-box domain-containing protein n=1 Tax=Heterodera trifolii TaxID=157864 RepID=A0ABD2L431_9BILA
MSDHPKEGAEKMAKAIFLSADCWLSVFNLLPPSQLGFGIALISRRFDCYVDEHFKTRKWALKWICVKSKTGENGTRQMEIANWDEKALPIPQMQLPRKVTGFECLSIRFIDPNVIAFLHRFRPLFDSFCPINLNIYNKSESAVQLLRNIWPMLAKNICWLLLFKDGFQHLRKFVPSLLNDCPSLRAISFDFDEVFAEFPADDCAMASDGQAVAKWLFTPHPDNVPKVFECGCSNAGTWSLKIAAFKAAFANASSPVNFIVVISIVKSVVATIVPFEHTNELTREQLVLKRAENANSDLFFLLVRSPIVRDASKWAKWEEEAGDLEVFSQWNTIDISINDEDVIGDGLPGAATPGPSDQQQNE